MTIHTFPSQLLLLTTLLHLGACGVFGPERALFGENRVTSASANQMFDSSFEEFDKIALAHLINPEINSADATQSADLDEAFLKANKDLTGSRRAQIQDRLIAASNQRCNLYMTYLKRLSSHTNGIFGTLTTILGGASAIVTGEAAAHILGGLAGISSGTRAELNQAIFESVTTSIITPAIQQRRAAIHDDIIAKRGKTMAEYTVEGAVADALLYHGACSIDAGLRQAQKGVESFEDVGLDQLSESLDKLNRTRLMSNTSELLDPANTQKGMTVVEKARATLAELKAPVEKAAKNVPTLQTSYDSVSAKLQDGGEYAKKAVELDNTLSELLGSIYGAEESERLSGYDGLARRHKEAQEFKRNVEDAVNAVQTALNQANN